MESTSSDKRQVFVSYSRADRQRVEGLCSLLEALGHAVFLDVRSILPGMRWRKKLTEALGKADVMLVFWTRFAARSKWVRREYETFMAKFPARPVVPILGDTTRLPEKLAEHQHADLFPLINELLATVRQLEEQGVGKREIRRVILERLEAEGIELPPDRRKRLFGLCGIVGIASAPLHFLRLGRDRAVEQVTAIPSAYYYTAGVAALAGGAICHTLFDADRSLLRPDIFPVPVKVGQSGTDACDAEGMICVSMSRKAISDVEGRFFGYSTPPCSAKVVDKPSCREESGYDTDFAIEGVVIRRSPDAHEGVVDLSASNHFCLSDAGKEGIFRFANCVKP